MKTPAKAKLDPRHAEIPPGEILATEFLEPLGITPYRLAQETGMPRSRVSDILKGKRSIAAATLPKLPPGLWRDRFQAVIDQADEIAAMAAPQQVEAAHDAGPAPAMEIDQDAQGLLRVRSTALGKAVLELYQIDLEMLFSKSPFELENGGQTRPAILPNSVIDLVPAPGESETTVAIPQFLRKGNLLVSAESGDFRQLKILQSKALELRHLPQERSVQVIDAATRKPLSKSYVKVFAEKRNGEVVFHKDGYTDLRGKYDYLSHTGSDPAEIKRLALLASHPEKGARTVIYDR